MIRTMSMEELEDMVFIHHGHEKLEKERFVPPINIPMFSKPSGCLWGAPFTPNEEYCSPWEEFFINGFPPGTVDRFASSSFKYRVDPGAKILLLDNKEDVKKLKENFYCHNEFIEQFGDSMKWVSLDWEKISKEYDGAYFTDNARYELYHILYGWDVESLCMFNLDHIRMV